MKFTPFRGLKANEFLALEHGMAFPPSQSRDGVCWAIPTPSQDVLGSAQCRRQSLRISSWPSCSLTAALLAANPLRNTPHSPSFCEGFPGTLGPQQKHCGMDQPLTGSVLISRGTASAPPQGTGPSWHCPRCSQPSLSLTCHDALTDPLKKHLVS